MNRETRLLKARKQAILESVDLYNDVIRRIQNEKKRALQEVENIDAELREQISIPLE